MAFTLSKLPYAMDALAPVISKETLEFHHGKHHQTYLTNLNKLVEGTPSEKMTLEEIIRSQTEITPLFNNAAQVWNHDFYFHSLTPNSSLEPSGALADAIRQTFGSFEQFKADFTKASVGQFGSGWGWLVKRDNRLFIETTSNAQTPLQNPKNTPIFTCDVWEHAYYIDYRNARANYLESFWKIMNWDFALKNFLS